MFSVLFAFPRKIYDLLYLYTQESPLNKNKNPVIDRAINQNKQSVSEKLKYIHKDILLQNKNLSNIYAENPDFSDDDQKVKFTDVYGNAEQQHKGVQVFKKALRKRTFLLETRS